MFGKRALPVGTLVVVLIIALAGLGLGYALWSTTLTDAGTVTTGTFGAEWLYVFTDDDGVVFNVNYDGLDIHCADDGSCVYPRSGDGSESARDPKEAGPNGLRYDKAVGACASGLPSADHTSMWWSVSNAYPSYYCTVWGAIGNTHSVPMKIQSRSLSRDDQIETGYADSVHCGDQIEPNGQLMIGMWIHVKDTAVQGGAIYSGSSSYTLVQWNEFSQAGCNF